MNIQNQIKNFYFILNQNVVLMAVMFHMAALVVCLRFFLLCWYPTVQSRSIASNTTLQLPSPCMLRLNISFSSVVKCINAALYTIALSYYFFVINRICQNQCLPTGVHIYLIVDYILTLLSVIIFDRQRQRLKLSRNFQILLKHQRWITFSQKIHLSKLYVFGKDKFVSQNFIYIQNLNEKSLENKANEGKLASGEPE